MTKRLFNSKDIEKRIKELAVEVSSNYKDRTLLVLFILDGASVLLLDLMRRIKVKFMSVDFIVTKIVNDEGLTKIVKYPREPLRSMNILLLADTITTGRTMRMVQSYVLDNYPETMRTCVLLDKKEMRTTEGVLLDYIGFTVPGNISFQYNLEHCENLKVPPDISINYCGTNL